MSTVSKRATERAIKWNIAQHIKRAYGCTDCGYRSHGVALQFDHTAQNKKGNVSNLIRSDYGWTTVLLEMAKCEIRCANCHAVITAARSRSLANSL